MDKPCQNCARQYFCDRKICNFISWRNTKNYGEVKKEEQNGD